MNGVEDLAEKTAEVAQLAQRAQVLALQLQASAAAKATGEEFSITDMQTIGTAYLRSMTQLSLRPAETFRAMQEAWVGVAGAWFAAWTGQSPETKDRRFRDSDWNDDPISRGWRDSFLAVEHAVSGLLSALPPGSKDHLRTEFYTRQFLSALSPANFLGLNPAARRRFMETDGQSVIDGFRNLLDDLERGDGRLDIATNDRGAFKVGRDLATTPGKIVFQNELMQLIQYEPTTETQHSRPMLFVPAWINKYYILDLRPKNSLVRYMLDRGHTVFVISWVNPGREHADRSFADYMTLGPLAALDAIRDATGVKTCNILGFCIGGILVTAMLAWLAARGDARRIGCATTLATMVDFTDVGEIGVFIDEDRLKALRHHMKDTGFLENHFLQDMFSMIRENDLVWSFHVMNYLMGRKPPAFDLLYWNSDSTRLPAAMLLWYLEKIYIANGLRRPGFLDLDGTPIDLGRISTPMYVLATREDHISPWKSVFPTTGLVGGEIRFVLGGSGHIAGVINAPSSRAKYGFWTGADYGTDPEDWLSRADYTEGSWWPDWANWVEKKDRARRVPARWPGSAKLPVLEDAPGSYVLAT